MNRSLQLTLFLVVVSVWLVPPRLAAERLAVHTFTVADGLAGDQLSCLHLDRQGFLWVGTRTGLSRFDGVEFRSYDMADGLPDARIYSLLEDAAGSLWVGTGAGLARVRSQRGEDGDAFAVVPGISDGVSALLEDAHGALWVAAADELYRLDPKREVVRVDLDLPWREQAGRWINALADTGDGGLWLGTSVGLFHFEPGAAPTPANINNPNDEDTSVETLWVDPQGRLWAARREVVVLMPPQETSRLGRIDHIPGLRSGNPVAAQLPEMPGELVRLDPSAGFATGRIFGFAAAADGTVWLAAHQGLFLVGDELVHHGMSSGLVSKHLKAVVLDDSGNAWLGTESHGLMRVSADGFTSFGTEDGLLHSRVSSVTLGPDRELVVLTIPPEEAIHLRTGDGFEAIPIPLPEEVPRRGWGLNQVSFFDHLGCLWVPTPAGLFSFPQLPDLHQLPHSRPSRRLLPEEEIFRIYEDAAGDIWLGGLDEHRLSRWERSTETLHHYGTADGISYACATAFAEDAAGALWIGFYDGSLARRRAAGGFERFDHAQGLPRGLVNCLLVDHRGWLWVGAQRDGLALCEDPTTDEPRWRLLSTDDGLASASIFSLAEDHSGRLYAGSLKGVDRLHPESGQIDHFDTGTGLVNNLVVDSLTAPDGSLWFATSGGVSHYRPRPPRERPAPVVLVDRLTVDGRELQLPLRGVTNIPGIFLPARTGIVHIGFSAVELTPGLDLDFEVALDPDDGEWSSTHGNRFVRLAGLAAGGHRIAIRARPAGGAVGSRTLVNLHIATPFWRSWWFLGLLVLGLTAGAWGVQRWRIQRLMELARVRSRIAADLHDEMGLALTRVAILADVAGRDPAAGPSSEPLQEIAHTARQLVDATSDMAWSLDPRHDSLSALLTRFRRQAADVVEGSGGRFEFAAGELEELRLGSEQRRHLLLILQEALRNACRHGRPHRVCFAVHHRSHALEIILADDGLGFDPTATSDGQGVLSMQRRAAEIGAQLHIQSAPDAGTRLVIRLPHGRNA